MTPVARALFLRKGCNPCLIRLLSRIADSVTYPLLDKKKPFLTAFLFLTLVIRITVIDIFGFKCHSIDEAILRNGKIPATENISSIDKPMHRVMDECVVSHSLRLSIGCLFR